MVTGSGWTVEQARGSARDAYDLILWGPKKDRPRPLPELIEPEAFQERSTEGEDGAHHTVLAVERGYLSERLRAWLENPPQSEASDANTPQGMLAAAVAFAAYQEMQVFGCQRLRALGSGECDSPSLSMGRRQIAKVGQRLLLRSTYQGGIPARNGVAMRPVRVTALWKRSDDQEVPWAGLPLKMIAPAGVLSSEAVSTDEQGIATLPLADPSVGSGHIVAMVDRDRLLGTYADTWGDVSVQVSLRQVPMVSKRLGIYLQEFIRDHDSEAAVAADQVRRGLKRMGYGGAYILSDDLGSMLLDTGGETMRSVVQRVADAALGKADVIIFGVLRSEFASSMGGRSVWHEASGEVWVFEAWSGREIAHLTPVARAVGVGDFNAGRKALKDVGNELVVSLNKLFKDFSRISYQQ